MKQQQQIGFIGSGQMSTAIIKGILNAKLVQSNQIHATDAYSEAMKSVKALGVHTHQSNADLASQCDVIVIGVKPNNCEQVLSDIYKVLEKRKPLIISIAAGKNIQFFEERVPPGTRLVRVMPNVNCLVGEAASGFSMSRHAIPDQDDKIVNEIFSAVGQIEHVSESLLDAVTGLSGSGPAYCYMYIEALADGGVRAGLPRPVAMKLAAQTVLGSAKMVLSGNQHPGQLKDMVCSPSGTTISGVHELEKGAFRSTVMNAVLQATIRSQELGLGLSKL
jgi:pyrroline-5-carboxylate reductase